jgi:hypothetical protein
MREADAAVIRREVAKADEQLNLFLREFVRPDGAAQPEGAPLNVGFRSVLDIAIAASYYAKHAVLHPFTTRMTSLPYVENWFCTMALALAQSARNPNGGRDEDRELRELFNEVNDYFVRLEDECYQEQKRDITSNLNKSSDCCGDYVHTRHWTKPRNWERTGATYEYYGTASHGYQYPATELVYVYERANIVTYAKLAVETIIQNVSTVMEACNPYGWDRRTPKSVYQSATLPKNYARRVAAWNSLVAFRNRVNFWKRCEGGLEPQDDPEAKYRNPAELPVTVVNP